MRNILFVLLLTALPVSAATADMFSLEKPGKVSPMPATTDKPLPSKRSASETCAGLGPGFVKIDGSDTCVKVGGAASVSVGAGR